MKRNKSFRLIPVLLLLILGSQSDGLTQNLFNTRDEGRLVYQKYKNRQAAALSKGFSKADRGVGILDRGELANVAGNFGIISNFHLFSPAFHWPSWADDTHQYCFGLELLVGVKGDVVTSIHDPATVAENFDWEAADGSLGNLFSGNVTVPDGTPQLASSDNPDTWPLDGSGNPFWPGIFRLNPETGAQVSGEFVSERDVYAEFTDQNNINGPYGLKVLQTAYSFSRSYARNFLIFDFQIINTSVDTLDSVWVGYMADFKVDFDAHDHLRFVSLDESESVGKDLVYLWDADPSGGNWDVTGYLGFLSLFTPGNRGITDFHYFDNVYEPSTNEQVWEIMSSDTLGSHITRSNYFHGQNFRIDNDSLADYMDPANPGLGTDFVFITATGALSIPPGDTAHSAFAVVMGASESDMFANARMVKEMSRKNYLGPNAPKSPVVQAFTGDKKVVVTWNGQASETSRDIITGKMDFEGYKVYRSQDFGLSWGTPITDERGNITGYVPIAQYDLDNIISGKDPNSNFFLGNNTGIKHTFVDSTVNNGVEYWYSVTAYDGGELTTAIPALESSRGITPDEPNVVSATPSAPAAGFIRPAIHQADSLAPLGGICDSRLSVEEIDPTAFTGHKYRVTFNDAGLVITAGEEGKPDTSVTTTFNLIDLTLGDTLLQNHPLLNETNDNIPVVDGFRVLPKETEPAVTFLGWTLVNGDTCTYEWRVTNFEAMATNPQVGPEAIYTGDDYRLTVDYTAGNGSDVQWYDIFTGQKRDSLIHIPLKIEVITDPDNPVEIGDQSWLREYDLFGYFPNRNNFFSPFGWDLKPGGAGFNPNNFHFAYLWVDIINPERKIVDPISGLVKETGLYLLTQNYPDAYIDQYGNPVQRTAVKPAQGDEFTILTKKLFRSDIYYEFETPKAVFREQQVELNRIKVVPNPFIVRAGWERSQFEGRLQFTHLPPQCDIDIYTTAGDHVITLHHDSIYDHEFWNLQNQSGVKVAYGLYVFIVKTPGGEKHTGKFVIIR